MGIIHRNGFEHSLRFCNFVAFNNLGLTHVRICDNGRARIPNNMHFYSDLDPAFLLVATNVQLDCFKTPKLRIWGWCNDSGHQQLRASGIVDQQLF